MVDERLRQVRAEIDFVREVLARRDLARATEAE